MKYFILAERFDNIFILSKTNIAVQATIVLQVDAKQGEKQCYNLK